MALRSRDNALPATLQRPKKLARVTSPPSEAPLDPLMNSENAAPPPGAADQSPEYVASEDLEALADPEGKIKDLMIELNSKDWIKVCEALNDVRRLALHHSSILSPILEDVLLVMVKSMKNPRSALIKTSIMASTDIFQSYGPALLSTSKAATTAFEQLLLQLLLKASQDKKFVCEEAEKALEAMAFSISPIPLLNKLQCYASHSNMRVRAKAGVAISKCVSKMDIGIMREFGLAKLLQMGAELLNDRLPEAREAARSIVSSIHSSFTVEDGKEVEDDGEEGSYTKESWQDFCTSNLPPISAQSIAKIGLP